MSNVRAVIREDWDLRGVRVALADLLPDGGIIRAKFALVERERIPPEEAMRTRPDDGADDLVLRDDEARALYEALAEHYGHGTNDVRALRRDYDAERVRVDNLVEAVVSIATRGAGA